MNRKSCVIKLHINCFEKEDVIYIDSTRRYYLNDLSEKTCFSKRKSYIGNEDIFEKEG